VNENWRKLCNKELMRQSGNLDLLSFVGIRLLNWNVHVNRMDNKRTVSQEFKNNPQGGVLRGRPKHMVELYIDRC